ncbi:hypothetical protein C9374_001740 [Naegleria lovaniensis]|uniref:Uncharacterized protein n=1 Tax=Naegleria lovaniensis TaxID=51637 RepID=A0AA88GW45_NAELO|nr:uncharacterized protein C9374_001740 [Naegleria lovaniensis]KAG2387408.1 hypothetical protein C9374_001740 [Naegleria lovaniensis]
MLSLLELVYDKLTYTPTYNILIIGIEESGKTELLQTIKQMNKQEIFSYSPATVMTWTQHSSSSNPQLDSTFQFNFSQLYSKSKRNRNYNPTIGQNTFNIEFAKTCNLKIWDIGGNLKTMWNDYYKSAHSIFFVINYNIEIRSSKIDENSTDSNQNEGSSEETCKFDSHLSFNEQVQLSIGSLSAKIDIYHRYSSSFKILTDILNEYKDLFQDIPIFLCINSIVTCYDEFENIEKDDDKKLMINLIETYKNIAMNEFNKVAFSDSMSSPSKEGTKNILYSGDYYKILIKHLNVCEPKKVYELLNSVVDYLHQRKQARELLDSEFI